MKPNPAKSGETLTITGVANTTVAVILNGGKTKKVKLDANGVGKFDIPQGFDGTLIVSDENFPKPDAVRVDVLDAGSGRKK